VFNCGKLARSELEKLEPEQLRKGFVLLKPIGSIGEKQKKKEKKTISERLTVFTGRGCGRKGRVRKDSFLHQNRG
jgi:hypothetical protein